MILKKPYGILIKYFKAIHFILLGLAIILAFKVNDILRYFNDFIANKIGSVNATDYASPINFFLIIIIAALCSAIYALLKHKNKPRMLYLFLIASYITTFGILIYTSNNLSIIETDILEPQYLRLARDILRLDVLLQYASIAVIIVRALGFDIKKFDFKKDIEELQIDVGDSEEFELSLGVNTDDLKRKSRKQLRELRYYIIENKAFVTIATSVVVIILVVVAISKIDFTKRNFHENTIVNTPLYNIEVTNSYITNKSYNNTTINPDDKTFIIIKINVQAHYQGTYQLETNDFFLNVNKENYNPTKKYYKYFKDIGIGYDHQNIPSNNSKSYILVYNIDNKYLGKKIRLKYKEGFTVKNNTTKVSEKYITLNPVNLDENQTTVQTTYLREELSLDGSLYQDTNLTINKYQLQDESELSKNGHGTVLILNATSSKLDPSISSVQDLIASHAKVKYTLNGKDYTSKIMTDVTPNSSQGQSYYEVSTNVSKASKIWLELNIRNKQYIYNLSNKPKEKNTNTTNTTKKES